ncbi:hypothetical protein HQ571_00370 [Candidatus Kuenenbacteria bacterium]|nr:hypothetical protein [Candidatus Kuenenbacteria bacterium]
MENVNTTNFQELFVNLLSKLSDREQEVLKQRYHLTSDLAKKATLRQIGESYNITRERVRQIEREAVRKLVKHAEAQEFAGELKQIEVALGNHLERQGGLVREDHLLENYVNENYELDFLHSNAFLFVLEHVFDTVVRAGNHDKFYSVWALKQIDLEKIADLLGNVETHLNEQNKVHSPQEIVNVGVEKLSDELKSVLEKYSEKHSDREIKNFVENYIHSASGIEKNILDQWGLSNWDTIRPKKLSDKINLIFQNINDPLHFRDLAENINDAGFDHKKICAATVHNELIANKDFVLIGRGIYAPGEWGYSTGTVSDIITKILQDSEEPLSKDEIFNGVLKQRKVNQSTIYLTLINKDKFAKTEDGRFTIK